VPAEQTPISRAISDVLTGYYGRKRLTQEQVAERADMSVVTLQKKLKAKAPITATDLVVLSNAIGVDPEKVLREAIEEVDAAGEPVSEAPLSLDDTRRRKQEEAARMSPQELEEQERRAAITDDELESDEPS
jgi:transcriptional regulator with XRE-family HTH domain